MSTSKTLKVNSYNLPISPHILISSFPNHLGCPQFSSIFMVFSMKNETTIKSPHSYSFHYKPSIFDYKPCIFHDKSSKFWDTLNLAPPMPGHCSARPEAASVAGPNPRASRRSLGSAVGSPKNLMMNYLDELSGAFLKCIHIFHFLRKHFHGLYFLVN